MVAEAYVKLVWPQDPAGPWIQPVVDWHGATASLMGQSRSCDLRSADAANRTEIWKVTGSQAQLDAVAVERGAAIAEPLFAGHFVSCAADVDRITADRIRALIGGIDPIQEQLKQLRLGVWSQYAADHATWPDGTTIAQDDKTSAAAILTAGQALNAQIEALRAEGKAFKASRGWT